MATKHKLSSDNLQRYRSIYDKICETASALTNAPAALLTRQVEGNKIQVIGARGTSIKYFDGSFELPRLHAGSRPALLVKIVADDPDFKDHPLLSVFPYCQSIYALIVKGQKYEELTVLIIINPDPELIFKAQMLESVHRLATIAHGVLSLENTMLEQTPLSNDTPLNGAMELIDRGPIPAALLNSNGRIVHANASFEGLFAKSRSKIKGSDFARLLHIETQGDKLVRPNSPVFEMHLNIRPGHDVKCSFLPVVTKEGRYTAAVLSPENAANHVTSEPGLREEHLQELDGVPPPSNDPTSHFLLKTLVKHATLHKRNDSRYMTLRSWRSAIKDYQIAAMTALKSAPPEGFVAAAADEIIDAARETFGTSHLKAVVPVPCGNSGSNRCLSVLVAEQVAAKLGLPVCHALQGQGGNGASTPKKSPKLKPYQIAETPPEAVLLVDDIASSGRHQELAIDALRQAGASVQAIAWIGNKRAALP